MLAELWLMLVLLIVAAVTAPSIWIPPAMAIEPLLAATLSGSDAVRLALLAVIVLLIIVSVPPTTCKAPESAKRPLGALALASFPLMVELMIVKGPRLLTMPPPSASLASADKPDAEPTRLLLTVVLTSVSVPQLSMPPPSASANGHWPSEKPAQGIPESTSAVGSARLPVITLFEIVTVAPPEKSAFGGMSIPPPVAHTPGIPKKGIDSGLVCARPPVIVTPLIATVGSVVAP